MLEVYSLNTTVAAGTAVPFDNVAIKKGNTVELVGVSTIQFNKCGVYMVSCDGSSAAAATIQLTKNGVVQSQAQSTGENFSFVTLIQVPSNNSDCYCVSPTTAQIINGGDAAATLTNINLVITKIC